MQDIEKLLLQIAQESLSENLSIYKFALAYLKNSEVKIMVELDKLDDKEGSVSIQDCQDYSKRYSFNLDAKVITKELPQYSLEIASAGIEREIDVLKDLERFQHRYMKVEFLDSNENLKKYILKYKEQKGNEIVWNISNVKWNIKQGIETSTKKKEKLISIDIDKIKQIHLYLDY